MSQETYACETSGFRGRSSPRNYIQVGSQPPVHKSGAFTVHVVGCHGFTTVLLRQPLLFWRRGNILLRGGSEFIPEIFRASRMAREIGNRNAQEKVTFSIVYSDRVST